MNYDYDRGGAPTTYTCPECGHNFEKIWLGIWMTLQGASGGLTYDEYMSYQGDRSMTCTACGHKGKLRDFHWRNRRQREPKATP